jgi:phage tail-like protein
MATDTAPAAPAAPATARPTPASSRQYLRGGLPGVYREGPGRDEEGPFAMRFVGALEGVLDPVVAILDLLPAHLDLALAPPDVVALVGAWLGLELDQSVTLDNQRRLVRVATHITRSRGTLAGIQTVLALAFPHVDGLEVHDSGGVTRGAPTGAAPEAADPMLVVTCPAGVTQATRDGIRRVVEEMRPIHVRFELVLAEGEEAG